MLEFLRNLFDPLFDLLGALLTTFHGWGAPWWLSIVMLTFVVRTVLFPLTFGQVKNMRRMQELKPEMDEIRKRHKGDSRKQQEELMRLYAQRKINPLGGCLPILVQLPIFLVLYYTIKEFEHLESFRTGGLFWFADLTAADPLFILPIAYIITLMASQEVTLRSTVTQPQQKQIMRILPVVFGIFLIRFPAALFVYWVTSNIISLVQNLIVYRLYPSVSREDQAEQGEHAGKPLQKPIENEKPARDSDRRNGKNASGKASTRRRKRKKSRSRR